MLVLRVAVIILLLFVPWRQTLAESHSDLPIVPVEAQPLNANVERVIATLTAWGTPLAPESIGELQQAAQERNAGRIQQVLDHQVHFAVEINPEERVKVRRGPAHLELQQHGFVPVLIKVLNDSTATKRLQMTSPQAGAVYSGVAKLSMQRQQSLDLIRDENLRSNPDRFLSVELFRQPPMTDQLSGLEVEYLIGLILSTEAGQRDITIGFDLGQQEQDLAFRGQASTLVNVLPAISVPVVVNDEGTPSTASLIIQDERGRVYPLQPKRLAPDFFFQPQIYRADGETVLLPPGKFRVQSSRGPEYWVQEQDLIVDVPQPDQTVNRRTTTGQLNSLLTASNPLQIELKRWVNPLKSGFYSGDHHIHAAGCAHYTLPTEGVSPEDMFRQIKGEGLNVGCVLTWGPCYRHQRQFFSPKPNNLSEPLTLLKYDLEISGFGSQALGHVCLLNLQDQTYPGSDGTETKGWPTWTTPVMRWSKQQGGTTGYAHSASGLAIDPAAAARRLLTKHDRDQDGTLSFPEATDALLPEPETRIDSNRDQQIDERELVASLERVSDQLPNLAVPQMNGVGAMEICVATAEGVCDFISSMDTRRIQEWNTWYHLMNCGFPLKVSGETDFPCMSSTRVGQGRVYVKLNADRSTGSESNVPLDFTAWCHGLAAGQSYVSDGFAHALDFQVNQVRPGRQPVELNEAGHVHVQAEVTFSPETPDSVAQGTIVPTGGRKLVGDTVDLHGPKINQMIKGGERLVELIVNGKPVASANVSADGQPHTLQFRVAITKSSWVALRQFPQLHTNPVDVLVNQQPIRASRSSAQWCEQTIELLWQNRERTISPGEHGEAQQTFERAKETYRRIAHESEAGT